MNRKKNNQLKYLGILFLLSLPLLGLAGVGISRNIITPNDQFFVVDKGDIPEIDVNFWNLTIDGHVDNVLSFNYSEFTSLPSTEAMVTLQCVDGPFATAVWRGISLKDLLDIAGVQAGAVDVIFHAEDDFTSSLMIEEASVNDILLAYEMNHEILPVVQGFPVRVVAPNHLGYKWVKWVVRIEIVTHDHLGFWESRGWSDDASITPFSDWIWHATLLSISFLFGGITIISGLKTSPITDFYRDLPKFVNRRFHISVGISYFLTSSGTFLYWIIATILNRGAIFYTIHGILALASICLVIPGAITGLKKRKKRNINNNTAHYNYTLYSLYFFIATVILGFMLMFFNNLRLY